VTFIVERAAIDHGGRKMDDCVYGCESWPRAGGDLATDVCRCCCGVKGGS
jgi:hypothetical protein